MDAVGDKRQYQIFGGQQKQQHHVESTTPKVVDPVGDKRQYQIFGGQQKQQHHVESTTPKVGDPVGDKETIPNLLVGIQQHWMNHPTRSKKEKKCPFG